MINISIAEERKRNKEAFRKLHQKAGSKEEDVMSRFIVTAPKKAPICVDVDGNEVSKAEKGFDECYVNPMPCQHSERMRRKNEVMVWE